MVCNEGSFMFKKKTTISKTHLEFLEKEIQKALEAFKEDDVYVIVPQLPETEPLVNLINKALETF